MRIIGRGEAHPLKLWGRERPTGGRRDYWKRDGRIESPTLLYSSSGQVNAQRVCLMVGQATHLNAHKPKSALVRETLPKTLAQIFTGGEVPTG